MARIKKTPIRRAKPPTPVRLPSVKAARASTFESLGEGIADVGDTLLKKEERAKTLSRRSRGVEPAGYNQAKSLMDNSIKNGFSKSNATHTQGQRIRDDWPAVKARLQKSNPQVYTEKTLASIFDYMVKNSDYVGTLDGLRKGLVGDSIKTKGLRVYTQETPRGTEKVTTQGGKVVKRKKDEEPDFVTFATGQELRHELRSEIGDELMDQVTTPEWVRSQTNASFKAYESYIVSKLESGSIGMKAVNHSLDWNLRLGRITQIQRAELHSKFVDGQTKGMINGEKRIAVIQAQASREADAGIEKFGRDKREVSQGQVEVTKKNINDRIIEGKTPISSIIESIEQIKYSTPRAKNEMRKYGEELSKRQLADIYGVGTQRSPTAPFLDYSKEAFQPPQEAGQAGRWFSDFMAMEMTKSIPEWKGMDAVERHSRVQEAMRKVGLPITTSMGQWVDNNYTKFNSNAKSWALARAVTSGDQASVDKILNLPDTSGGGVVNSSNYVTRPEEMKVRQTGVNKLMNKAMDRVKGK